MKIYVDNDYKCHAAAADGYTAIETDVFNGKCEEYVEGYRYVPEGETWTRNDGMRFTGLMVAPWVDSRILEAYQFMYEKTEAETADMKSALNVLGVTNE